MLTTAIDPLPPPPARAARRLVLGRPATCSDGAFGELVDIVVDPGTLTVTHLVVEPHHRHWMARLVPIDLVAGDATGALAIGCTLAQARELALVQRSTLLALGADLVVDDPDWDVGGDGVLMLPCYGSSGPPSHDALETAVYDRIPKGEIEIRRASGVTSSDDHRLGHVEGLVVDADEHVSHVLVERGHLWCRRELQIPIEAVADVRPDAIRLSLTRRQVGRLEPAAARRR